MTPAELKQARRALGLSQARFAAVLGLEGENADRVVRRWELGERPIPGPIKCIVKLIQSGVYKPQLQRPSP